MNGDIAAGVRKNPILSLHSDPAFNPSYLLPREAAPDRTASFRLSCPQLIRGVKQGLACPPRQQALDRQPVLRPLAPSPSAPGDAGRKPQLQPDPSLAVAAHSCRRHTG